MLKVSFEDKLEFNSDCNKMNNKTIAFYFEIKEDNYLISNYAMHL